MLAILLGWWIIRRRYGIGWSVFALGALTFVLSQVVHLPLNAALGLLGGGRGVALWPLVPMALVAGLSASICEEGARLLVLLFLARHVRGWRPGLQYGAGTGGLRRSSSASWPPSTPSPALASGSIFSAWRSRCPPMRSSR